VKDPKKKGHIICNKQKGKDVSSVDDLAASLAAD
jgi:hypothetical protein